MFNERKTEQREALYGRIADQNNTVMGAAVYNPGSDISAWDDKIKVAHKKCDTRSH